MKKATNFGIEIDPKDYKYILKETPDGFSPERNKAVVDEAIRKTDENIMKKRKQFDDNLRERSNALASYFKYLDHGGGGNNPLMKYFSRKTRAYLRGEKIIEQLRGGYRVINGMGQIVTYHAAD